MLETVAEQVEELESLNLEMFGLSWKDFQVRELPNFFFEIPTYNFEIRQFIGYES